MDVLGWLFPIVGSLVTTLITIAIGAVLARRKRRQLQHDGMAPEQLRLDQVRSELVDTLQDQVKAERAEKESWKAKYEAAVIQIRTLRSEIRDLKDTIVRFTRRHPELVDERD